MMGLKSKKSHLSQSSSSSSLAGSSATGSFSVVSRRGQNTPSSSTFSLPSSIQDSNQPIRSSEKLKEKDKSMTRISGFFSSSKKGKEKQKAAVQTSSSSIEPETDAVVPETMSSLPALPTTLSELHSWSESSSRGRSRSAEHPRQPLFVANPDPSSEISSVEPLSFSTSESSSSSTSGYTSQTSDIKSDISSMKGEKKKKDPLILTFDPSTSTQLTLTATNGVVLDAVPLSHLEEDPPAYTLHPQLQCHPTPSSDPNSENSPSATQLRPKKVLTKPAPLRHISTPALPTQDRPQLPLRAISVPDVEFVTHNGSAMGQILDRIDELDESIPYGVNLHVGGPFDAARTVENKVAIPSSKPSHSQPGFLDPVTTVPYTPFGIPKGGLQVGQVIPRSSLSSQSQHIGHQKRPSYTNHHLQPRGVLGLDHPQNRMSTLSLMSALPSPGFSDDSSPGSSSVPVAVDSLYQSNNGRAGSMSSPVAPGASARPEHVVEASSSSTASGASSYHTAPHSKYSNRWNAYDTPSPSNDASPSNQQIPRTPNSANWNTTAYGGIDHENDSRANIRQSQIGLALSSPLPETSTDGRDHERTPAGAVVHIAEDEDEGTERVGMAILMAGSSDDEEAHQETAVPSKTAAADEPVSNEKDYSYKFSEIRDEDYEYWTGPSGPRANLYHSKFLGYEPMQMTWDSGKRGWEQSSNTDELQCHSPYSLLDDKDAVERFGGPPNIAVSSRKPSQSMSSLRDQHRESSDRFVDGALVAAAKRSSSLPPIAQTHLRAASSHPVSGPPQPRPPPTQQRSQTMHIPDDRNPSTLFITTPQFRSLQPSPTGSPYHSNSHSPNHSPAALHLYPAHMQLQNSNPLEVLSVNQSKHHSLPSSPERVPRTWTPQGPINTPHQRRPTDGVNEIRAPNRAAVNGHLTRYPDHQQDPTSSTSMPLPPGAGATQTPLPTRFTPPSQNPHFRGKNDIPPVSLNRPRHAPTNLVMPAPLQGQGPTNRPRSPYHSNGPSPAQKYPPPPPIPPIVNGSAGKVLRKRSSIAHTTSALTRPMNGGDEWGYMSTGGYASEGAVGKSKTMQSKKAPKRVLSKRRADL